MSTTRIWAISDTHLSFARPRDQARFGERWCNHTERIKSAWQMCIQPDDIVLMPGDLSWAHTPRQVQPDVDWVATLPGRKVLIRGNHDFWWKKLDQVQRDILPDDNMYAVQGSCLALDGVLVCGTMGHIAPNDPYYQQHKFKSYQREIRWLHSALQQAQQMQTNHEPIILMLHYPPFTSEGAISGFTEVINQFSPNICVYGHLHLEHEWRVAINGENNGTRYHLVAADYLEMIPRPIWPP